MVLNKQTFEEVYEEWNNRNKNSKESFYPKRAKKYGYPTAESFRSAFRRARKKHLPKVTNDKNLPASNAKILVFDVETGLRQAFTFGVWEQNIPYDAIIQDTHLLCWAAKWLYSDKVFSDVLNSKEAREHNDKRIAKSMWELLDEADIVVAHNGKKFDVRHLNTRFLVHGLGLPSSYSVVDTLTVARSNFSFASNKLDSINAFLGLPVKKHTGLELWKRCFYGEPEALIEMVEYNQNDVNILEEMYVMIRPFIKSHPNMGLYFNTEGSVCPNCGSTNLTWRGYYYTPMGRYRSYRCECGAIGRAKKTDLSKTERQKLVR